MRSARLADYLTDTLSVSPEAARKQISRARGNGVSRLPQNVLPKGEGFLYLQDDWASERFWTSLLADMRATHSIYGIAMGGLMARGGVAQTASFKVVSGAPVAQKRQVPVEGVIQRLTDVGLIERREIGEYGECVALRPAALPSIDSARLRARLLAENVLLDALREWARKLGLASYNSIAIRNGADAPQFSTFLFDLCGPSYLAPLVTATREGRSPGFLVADVFCDQELDVHNVQYFIRKVQLLKAMRGVVPFLPVLVADRFTNEALRAGRGPGIVMATTSNLFGEAVAAGLATLIDTLQRAAAVASTNPEKISQLLNALQTIEGGAGNLRGALFEMIVGYLVREVEGNTIDIGEIVRDPRTGKQAEIDVRRIKDKQECWFYECRGKQPTGRITETDVGTWIERINRIHAFHRAEPRFQNYKFGFELWTTGGFDDDAIRRLKAEKQKRTKITIDWRDGPQVREYAKKAGRRSILDTLDAHYFKHPLEE